ncbi:MAG TPA: xanthine dehydrogenase family protein molybdopterin-binding subunit [Ktedonobacterales bacterium]|nr:xanthine dehydrogenase family protein molybdopterin-binding subunit [Ktedonobacterales bacterium]
MGMGTGTREASAAAIPRRRIEDERLITGRGQFVDDVRLPDRPAMLHAAFVRSPYAHATIAAIHVERATAQPGVVDVLSGADLAGALHPFEIGVPLPDLKKPERWPLAVEKARYVGDPVAVVLAESAESAETACDLVEVDYTPLPVAVDVEAAAAADAPLLYDDFGSNVAFEAPSGGGDVEAAFARADHTVTLRLVNQRLAPSSLEPRACLFDYQPETGELHAWLSSQAVYGAREALAGMLDLDRARIHVVSADVGGGFGSKTRFVGEEFAAALLAVRHGRPVKWIETRSENLQTQTHGRGQVSYVEAAFTDDGLLLGLKVRTHADLGAFLTPMNAMVPARVPSQVCGPYRVRAVEGRVAGVLTNKVPTAPYRGAGRPEAAYMLERTMDRIAAELRLDAAEVRRRNLLAPDAFPYRTPTGLTYDSGNYQAVLDRALELADYQGWRAKQRERRATHDPRQIGIGLATFIESTGGAMAGPGAPQEAATVRILTDGTLLVESGVATNGQGHFTAFAQIAASVFGLPASSVAVRMGNSDLPAFGIGTFGSRTLQTSGTAVHLAAQAVREKALHVAAERLEANPADLVIAGGKVMVQGVPGRAIGLGELARLVEEQPDLIAHEPPNRVNGAPIEGLAAWRDFAPPGTTFAFGAHIAVVEVDTETGEVRLVKMVAVDDCGRVLNPFLVEAQVRGGLAQGIGQALYEEAAYDAETGQPLGGTLLDYSLPTMRTVPAFVTDSVETPSPLNPLGAKGVGEAGTIGGPPAVVNAALDALAPLGITALDMPLTPQKVWSAIEAAHGGRD